MKEKKTCSVQIIFNDDIHRMAKKHYPNLYREVLEQDSISKSSWYKLSKPAYEEYKKFRYMMHRKKYGYPVAGFVLYVGI